ncbi:2-oxoacid:ferredoxin oxidoreductase subunit beta [candidate division WOR-3 bacterium]|jgi:2-oxoglutarate ferredoxin oxidoreductase subunit beta|nr:2-oxoacid:ferredoxin oxidoreductase subunit beta [candidate division WOR-3 bacterium]
MRINDYIIRKRLPFFFCAGCGHGISIKMLTEAFYELNIPKNNIVTVTGIGCYGKADDYIDTNTMHTVHGRALAYATGVKVANPKLTVVAMMGDGDSAAIGGNHLIHAARRNLGITALVSNNMNYGMTGGQYSPTTPYLSITATSPYGFPERALDLCELVIASGGTFVARTTVFHTAQLKKYIKMALQHKGFSFIEILSPCPTQYGKNNKLSSAPKFVEHLKEITSPVSKAKETGKIPIGILKETNDVLEYNDAYMQIVNKIKEKK